MSLPFVKFSSFQSLISRKQLREIELQMVSVISFGWFAGFVSKVKVKAFINVSMYLVFTTNWGHNKKN